MYRKFENHKTNDSLPFVKRFFRFFFFLFSLSLSLHISNILSLLSFIFFLPFSSFSFTSISDPLFSSHILIHSYPPHPPAPQLILTPISLTSQQHTVHHIETTMTAITHSPLVDRLEYEDQEHLETASIESTRSSSVQNSSSPSASSSSTSLDQLLPAMTAEGTTPAPSDDHSDMVSHSSEIILHDEESFHGIHHSPPPPFEEISRPNSPSPPRTVTTPLVVDPHPLAHSISAYHHHEETSGPQQIQLPTPGSSTPISSSPPRASRSTHHRNGHGSFQNHHTLPSPFSFFSHSLTQSEHPLVSPPAKTLKIELEEPEIVLMTGTTATLKGTLFLNLQKNTKIKTLHLEFSGRSSVTWIDGK